MKLVGSAVITLMFASMMGCASTPPSPELVDARTGYARAQTGPAKTMTPAELETARQALDKAEQAFHDDPGSQKAKDLAYLASRKVMVAEVRGRIAQEEMERKDADLAFKKDAESKLDSKNAQLTNKNQQLTQTSEALTMEQQARRNAEQRAREALDRLSALAAVKQDTRGTVITLNGSVLFATNKSDLLPGASERLNQVADALKEQPDRDITVFGFTDSQGNDAYNQTLSEKRAASVRQYLVDRGVATDKIKSVGKGKADPVADNASAEGRANNRRVEIVIGNPGGDSGNPGTTSPSNGK